MKIAPIYRESLKHSEVLCKIVHTGQHYDYELSQAFFDDLKIPQPNWFFNTGSGSHANQVAKIMIGFEEVCEKEKPDLVIVVGDVNSTLACSVVAKKLLNKVAHVEAGLRSFDMTMPEEVNRIVTDSIADYFFVTEKSAIQNLLREGKPENKIYFVGNVMIDNLYFQLEKLERSDVRLFSTYPIKQELKEYAFLTLHRPSNVDNRKTFDEIGSALNYIAREIPILFPAHPRTQKMIHAFSIRFSENILLLPPLSFNESLYLWKDAKVVLTDSGGLQEETTALGVPCITLRENTERPITLYSGTNVLAGTKKQSILDAYHKSILNRKTEYHVPPKWDGKAAERIWKALLSLGHLPEEKANKISRESLQRGVATTRNI
jgi:UDP-N-acetylglucosamine 2-epimerase (non-hydrolysing)